MIYRCVPRKVKRVWGSLPGGVGELWWVYDDPGESAVLEPLSGGEPTELAAVWQDSRFPLLVKTLHTSMNLSIQVHPGFGGCYPGKDETWVVLEGRGAIMAGLVPGTTRESFLAAVERGAPERLLEIHEAFPGMTMHLPAGTVHSLGPGLSVLEVQANCDVTYRIWDWGRTGDDGKPRPLHMPGALDSVDWGNLGRPVLPVGPVIDGGPYMMEKVEGPLVLSAWEVLFMPGKKVCLLADRDGGRVHASPGTWKAVIRG